MKKSSGAAAIAGILTTYLLVHAAALGYAFFLVRDLSNDPVGPMNEYVAAAQNDYGLFLSIFATAATITLLSAGSFIGLLKRVAWGRHCWLLTSMALVVSLAVAILSLQAKWDHFAFPLLASAAGWWLLLTDKGGGDAG